MSLFLYNYEKELNKLFEKYQGLKSIKINDHGLCEINEREFRFENYSNDDMRGWLIEQDLTIKEVLLTLKVVKSYRPFVGEHIAYRPR